MKVKMFINGGFLFVTLFAIVPMVVSANTVYRPGLVQVLFEKGSANGFATGVSGVPVLASNLVETAKSDSFARGPELVPYPLMDRDNNVANPVTGKTWSWPNEYATFAYEGEIYVTAGTTYTFYGRFDDGSALVIDGSLVLLQREESGYNKQPQVWGDWTAPKTGWVPFNGWIWDWTGGKATRDCYYALQFNTAAVKDDFGNASKWSRFEDPLDMSFLRATTGESFTTLSSFAKSGDDMDITVTATGLPSAATITACWGAADAGLSSSAWDHVAPLGSLATNAAGTVTASFTVPGAASATAMRLFLEGESGTTGYFTEWTEAVATSVEPILSIDAIAPGYTNATVTVNLSGFGVGATENTITLEIASSADGFATPVATYAYASNPATGAGVYAVSGGGLATNTTYWVRAVSENDVGGSGATVPVSFTTLDPGFATGSAAFAGRGFTTLSATGLVTALGDGSTAADVRLEVSLESDFATLASVSTESAAALDAATPFVCEGLAPDTTYHLRLRIVNEWGLVTYVPVDGSFATRSVPISATGIGYAFSADGSTVDISFGVSEVFDGATCTATLSYGGRTFAAQFFSAAGALSWPTIPAAGPATATVTVTSTVGGTAYTQTWTMTVTPGARSYALSSLLDLRSKIFRVGDSATLPELTGATDYYVLTDCRAFELGTDGVTLTALEPGFGGVVAMEYSAASDSFVRNDTMGFGVVVPEPNGAGRVWLCTKSDSAGYDWTTVGWENLTDDAEGYPNGADDVAMIAIPGNSTFYVDVSVTVGAVYFGFDTETVLPGRATNNSNGDQSIWFSCKNASTLTFVASGKNRALLRLCNFGNRNLYDNNPHIKLGYWNTAAANQLSIVQTGDLDWDCGAVADYTDTATRDVFGRVRIGLENGAGWTVPAGTTLHILNVTGYKNAGDDQGGNAQFWFNPTFPFVGSGEIVYDGPGSAYVNNPFHDFDGMVTVRNKQRYSHFSMGSRGGSFWMVNWTQPWASNSPPANASLTIEGDVGYNSGLALDRSYGVVSYGNAHGFGSWGYTTNALPGKKWIMNGGAYYQAGMNNNSASWREDGTTATETIRVPNGAETLCISNGFSFISLGYQQGDTDRPTNNLEFARLEHAGDGVLVASNDRMWNSYQNGGGGASWRVRLVLDGFHDHAIGGTGAANAIHGPAGVRTNILESTAPIVPWIVAPVEAHSSIYFPGASPEGELVMAGHPKAIVLDEVVDPTMNVCTSDKTIALSSDRTVNSLRLVNNRTAGKNLGEGRTLTITSGGLIMGNGNWNNTAFIGDESGYNAGTAGTIYFPNKAYVFAPVVNASKNYHPEIWAKMVSPHGAVFSYPGYLDLGGDQTGIDDHIAVNGTYLSLGSSTTGCKIDVPVHLHGAYSTLSIQKQGSFCKQTLYFWDHGTPGSKFIPPAGETERVYKLYIDGKSVLRGTWGSSESGAENVDDNHFSGTGLVRVLKDDLADPLVIRLK